MPSKTRKVPKGRFMPPAGFKTGKGIPQPNADSPMFKRGGKVKLSSKKGRRHG